MIGGRSLNGGLGGQEVDHTLPPIRPQASLDLAGPWKMAVAFRKVCTLARLDHYLDAFNF